MEPPQPLRGRFVMLPALLFLFGIFEYVMITAITNSIADARRLAATLTVFLYVSMWYLVGREVILGSADLALFYAAGCSAGTFITCKDNEGKTILGRFINGASRLGV